MAADFVVLNLVFLSVCLGNPDIAGLHRRLTWLLMNVAFIPAWQWLKPICMERAMQMDRVMRAALMTSVTHLIVFLALLYVMGDDELPWHVLMEFCIMQCVCFLLWRVVSQWILKRYRSHGGNTRQTIIIGCRTTAERLYEEMMHDTGYGYDVLGFYDIYCPPDFKYKEMYRGNIDDFERCLDRVKVDEVFYTLSGEDGAMVRRLLGLCDRKMMRFNFVPQMSSYLARNLRPENIGAVPVLGVRSNPLDNPVNTFIKRSFDILFSGAFLIVSPLIFIPVAIAVKLSSPGPVFFSQTRIGKNGRRFKIWKFRSMYTDAEARKKELAAHNEVKGLMFKMDDDPRVTRVGRFIRRTSIDETPQFLNILVGDMSLVGTRPPTEDEFEHYNGYYRRRMSITPGLTGLWQVSGRSDIQDFEEIVKLDLEYIDNWSLGLDIKILIMTVFAVLGGKGSK